MGYVIVIKNNQTGISKKVFMYQHEFLYDMWAEGGNYSCDCNRGIFYREGEHEGAHESHCCEEYDDPCGETMYSVTDVRGLDGLRTKEMNKFLYYGNKKETK